MCTIDCHKCKHCKIIEDPDPTDWFCDDDESIVCTAKSSNIKWDSHFYNEGDKIPFTYISVSNRPYQTKKEFKLMAKVWKARRPTWCPEFEEGKSLL